MQTYSVTLDAVISELHLTPVFLPAPAEELHVQTAELNRPSLLLAGYTQYFDNRRIQVCGKVEMSYLATLDEEHRNAAIDLLFSYSPPAIVVTRGLTIYDEMLVCAKRHLVPVLSSSESTSNFMSAAISYLNVALAPRITRHGVFVEVYGEGILILGESGVGKSETAIELLKRGHRLIADDAVELRRVSNKSIIGSSPDNIRHFIELRGVGIINVRRIFGMGAVKMTEKVDMVIQLVQWEQGSTYSNIETEDIMTSILDVEIPIITIPVKSGRNLAIIIEVAAMNNRQKNMGYNAARELLEQLGMSEEGIDD
ncbi:MAG: HPr(Ser) kinase/phosphatase [Oscillospiraceae bacterium]